MLFLPLSLVWGQNKKRVSLSLSLSNPGLWEYLCHPLRNYFDQSIDRVSEKYKNSSACLEMDFWKENKQKYQKIKRALEPFDKSAQA